ncbi:MAG: hypothetical protein LBF16_14280 [Pseudomonadales bacterium]|jgi:hypothetical protein|nr:hypothetical protein [Pseudomonadales bacterium]
MLSILLCGSPAVLAHHSYAGFDPEERSVFEGTITGIFWGNPHILLDLDDGNTSMRIEWITVTGARQTGVGAERFHTGDRLSVIGSRNRNPDIHVMTAIKALRLPADDWQWISPSLQEKRP